MKKISVQFHATYSDIFEFVMEMKRNNYKILGLILSPRFKIESITENMTALELKKYYMIVISRMNIQIEETYNAFMKNQDNSLLITVGRETETELYESSMSIWSELEISQDFKRYISIFKKNMNKGAWVVNPNNNAREYYRNHMYTDNARLAYERGVLIRPIAGWNEYILAKEIPH